MTTTTFERTRTRWDILLGIAMVLLGFYVLGNAVLATAITVLVIAWSALAGGIVLLVGALLSIRSSGLSWSTLLGGAMLTVLGLFMLRNPLALVATAVALTMLAGAMFFVSGVMRVGLALTVDTHKWVLVLSGVISIALGLWVLSNPGAATLKLLGVLLGVQVLVEGVTLLLAGRLRIVDESKESVPA